MGTTPTATASIIVSTEAIATSPTTAKPLSGPSGVPVQDGRR
ncbi:hypothetical protein ACVGOW_23830 [Pseudonocardia saturnea]